MTAAALTARRAGALSGRVRAPGDKSISHRALILGALAHGTTDVEGLLEGEDVKRTAQAMAAFGAGVERLGATEAGGGRWRIEGLGGLAEPTDVVDCGNSGTGVRLIMGAAAGFELAATFTGDASLRGRPMNRVLKPLGEMGASWIARSNGRLPLTLRGGGLRRIAYRLPEPSAQVKSAVLLAGLQAAGGAEVIEPEATRDHTERMLRAFGATVDVEDQADGRHIRLAGGQRLTAAPIRVPGDPSSAAFPLVAAAISQGDVTVEGLDPSVPQGDRRIVDFLQASGAAVAVATESVRVRGRALTAQTVDLAATPDLFPVLAVLASQAHGESRFVNGAHLRFKESDRIASTAALLKAMGSDVRPTPDGCVVRGPTRLRGAAIDSQGDHRILMAAAVAALAANGAVEITDAEAFRVSYPSFLDDFRALGAEMEMIP